MKVYVQITHFRKTVSFSLNLYRIFLIMYDSVTASLIDTFIHSSIDHFIDLTSRSFQLFLFHCRG